MSQCFILCNQLIPVELISTPAGQRLLAQAKARGEHAVCMCKVHGPRMCVVYRSGRYWLACYPDTVHEHDPTCPSYQSPGPDGERRALRRGIDAIIEDGGESYVHVSVPLWDAGCAQDAAAKPRDESSGDQVQRRTSLAALVHYLLGQGGLLSQVPGTMPAHWSGSAGAIDAGLHALWINGVAAADVVILPRLANQRCVEAMLADLRDDWRANRRRYRLLFGDVASVKTLPGDRVAIRLDYWSGQVVMDKARWLAAITHSASANAHAAVGELSQSDRDSRVLFLGVVGPHGYRNVRARTAALVVTSSTYMPVASGPELRVATALAMAAIRVEKPIRAHHLCVPFVPDFIAKLSACPQLVMEVAGLDTVEYLCGLVTKLEAYAALGLPVWVWFVAHEPMPPFAPQPIEDVLARARHWLHRARVREDARAQRAA